MKTNKDIIIIGAGAAGLSAAQYAARSNLATLVIEELAPGGQALVIDKIENYPGFPEAVSGIDLTRRMEVQARNFGVDFTFATVSRVQKDGGIFNVKTTAGELTALAVIVATGAQHKRLEIPGENEFSGRGVSYCATCDGPLFKNKTMLVVGGGDAACDESSYLANLSEKIIHIHRRDRFRAQRALGERVLKNPHIEVRFHTECREIFGNGKVTHIRLFNNQENKTYEQKADAVFVFVGSIPRTQFLNNVKLDEGGYIVTNDFMETAIQGLFAAGDVRATPFRQLVVAAGEGALAAHAAAQYIDQLKGEAYQ
jgi:thioredoxin reductase (NADPH)